MPKYIPSFRLSSFLPDSRFLFIHIFISLEACLYMLEFFFLFFFFFSFLHFEWFSYYIFLFTLSMLVFPDIFRITFISFVLKSFFVFVCVYTLYVIIDLTQVSFILIIIFIFIFILSHYVTSPILSQPCWFLSWLHRWCPDNCLSKYLGEKRF